GTARGRQAHARAVHRLRTRAAARGSGHVLHVQPAGGGHDRGTVVADAAAGGHGDAVGGGAGPVVGGACGVASRQRVRPGQHRGGVAVVVDAAVLARLAAADRDPGVVPEPGDAVAGDPREPCGAGVGRGASPGVAVCDVAGGDLRAVHAGDAVVAVGGDGRGLSDDGAGEGTAGRPGAASTRGAERVAADGDVGVFAVRHGGVGHGHGGDGVLVAGAGVVDV